MMFPDSKNVTFIQLLCRPNFSTKSAVLPGCYRVKFGPLWENTACFGSLKCGAAKTSLFAVSFEAPCDGNFLLGLKLIALRKQEKIALFCWELWLYISLQRSPRGSVVCMTLWNSVFCICMMLLKTPYFKIGTLSPARCNHSPLLLSISRGVH